MSASSAGDGSSSTTIARFSIASRKRRGMDARASATHRSNAARVMLLLDFRRFPVARAGDDQPEVVAVLAHHALIAERLRFTDAPPVQNERVGRARPSVLRHRGAQLLLDRLRIVSFCNADPVRHT